MNDNKIKFSDYIKVIIAIILLIICIITSFRTGQKFYELEHSGFEDSQSYIDSDVAKFDFKVTIKY